MFSNVFKKKATSNGKVITADINRTDLERLQRENEHINDKAEAQTLKREARLNKNRMAKAIMTDGTEKEFPYYWAEGHDGYLYLTALNEDGTDEVTVIDMKKDVKTLTL